MKGLRQRKTSVINIFRVWDRTLFPHTSKSLSGKSMQITTTVEATRDALDALNADNEDLGGDKSDLRDDQPRRLVNNGAQDDVDSKDG